MTIDQLKTELANHIVAENIDVTLDANIVKVTADGFTATLAEHVLESWSSNSVVANIINQIDDQKPVAVDSEASKTSADYLDDDCSSDEVAA